MIFSPFVKTAYAQIASTDTKLDIMRVINEVICKINLPGLTFSGGGECSFKLANIFTYAIGLGGLIALAIMIWAGFLYITSATNPSKATESKEWMKAAIWGLLLLFGGWMILYTINPGIVGR
ncbi:MAG: hypothetical protein A3H06_02005 [Candidatus Colwellbacteria bacterium RIFCSPLOWO2_12_FULL_44_13]|uniref:Uncharacterized protein n=3 Tax=Candidatus Colwelliibacteriota TaxID=1817904 RepID=A0A1G1Z6H0_9BACT|nr:MAG: hypothetical protein A3F24_02685 [Candidatus Colwellbacteria bacterium RIFCSPHIGHO2_12_FULL_44_17]OGY59480.1 MAG: hypothetical protein A3I31_03100 [Candidatus Colwellbacteria bacterium RIFCSPLOWO2_02_FULL_44_20b]OGY61488.1 MAG: hypothetical protein A3H06_02005 [Candidatus Colwellbacteria bacterium RIFCSPLOWO2_12_FULL_44_13]